MKKRNGYLIDPYARTVRPARYKTLGDIYRLLRVRCVDVARLDNGEGIYVDDNGLFADEPCLFIVLGYHSPLAGRGLWVGRLDDEGYERDPVTTLDEAIKQVTWAKYFKVWTP